ncbi:lysostaphin resistance A-like protein [Novosphingobium sp.]|uniref:CPBP family intramembrane glutamic endopeptidase n=1 Tax=Novosphingobium sp. TaxID=1874826 RepID=UPI0035B34300
MLIHIVFPAGLIAWAGGSLTDTFDAGLRRRGVVAALVVLSALMFGLVALLSPALRELAKLGITGGAVVPWVLASWAWMSVEAGLCEEYLFRAGLQSRLTTWLQSPIAAILIASVIFSLMHWPGLYLRGGPGTDGWSTDPIEVAAFCIASLSPIAILFGVLWARTRSLVLVVLVHGAVDALSNAADLVSAFR